MSQFFTIHPQNPQIRLIRQAVEILKKGGLIVYPTDSCYALGCRIGDKDALERMRKIRGVDDKHYFTLLCSDLSSISHYAQVDNRLYRLLKAATPGSYTFILQATREVPRRLQNPKRNSVGIRVPDNIIAQSLLSEFGEPILSTTLLLPDEEWPLNDAEMIVDKVQGKVDLVIDGGACGIEPTTVVDFTIDPPILVRQGKGLLSTLGMEQ